MAAGNVRGDNGGSVPFERAWKAKVRTACARAMSRSADRGTPRKPQ